MASVKLDPRVAAANKAVERARNALSAAEGDQDELFRELVHKVFPDRDWDCFDFGSHQCRKSPVGVCVYDDFEDFCHDDCLFCHEPEERK